MWLLQPSIVHLFVDVLTVRPDDAVLQTCFDSLIGLDPLRVHDVVRALGQKHVHLVVCVERLLLVSKTTVYLLSIVPGD